MAKKIGTGKSRIATNLAGMAAADLFPDGSNTPPVKLQQVQETPNDKRFKSYIEGYKEMAAHGNRHLAEQLAMGLRNMPQELRATLAGLTPDERVPHLVKALRPQYFETMTDYLWCLMEDNKRERDHQKKLQVMTQTHADWNKAVAEKALADVKAETARAAELEEARTRQQSGLNDGGRKDGAKTQKEYAAETKRIINQLDDDLLKNPDTARWDIPTRAKHIEKILNAVGIDKKPFRTQPNGTPYALGTIEKKIQGKG